MAQTSLTIQNPKPLSKLIEQDKQWAQQLSDQLKCAINLRSDTLHLEGESEALQQSTKYFQLIEKALQQGLRIRSMDAQYFLDKLQKGQHAELENLLATSSLIRVKNKSIAARTLGQRQYLQQIASNAVTFGIGPAGTGKTFLAMATALHAFLNNEVDKIILTRPAVEAGEALGFLPGDLLEKILPYLRPLYDAMYDIIGKVDTEKLIERGAIEIAPLAYMRGRTLAHSFVILDEAQNTTPQQMMMFLTRLGENSRMVITGDITQTDLPSKQTSGLAESLNILQSVPGIGHFSFSEQDVVRHPLVAKIIRAYEKHQQASR